ncbi:hypothetical protein [Flagellimonas flava]|uniref:hypothetical protein n=1 Tax=Flagellimonas flava TaxID=570519 RepID=UPI003D659FB9
MEEQLMLFKVDSITREADVVYTPRHVSKWIIDFVKPEGICLDPCKGDGAFYDFLPAGKEFCELDDGKDFFDFKKKCDWIIGNPPYSIFKEFLEHSFNIADNVSYLVPTNKVFQRQVIMDMIHEYGGIHSIAVFGSGTLIDFPFGFSVGNFHFKKGWRGNTRIEMGMNQIFNKSNSNTTVK